MDKSQPDTADQATHASMLNLSDDGDHKTSLSGGLTSVLVLNSPQSSIIGTE